MAKKARVRAASDGPELDRLFHGDCLELAARLPDGCVDLHFEDPPFNIGEDYDEHDDRMSEADYLDWCERWMLEVRRTLKPDGTFWLAIGPRYASELDVLAKSLGFRQRKHCIWAFTFGVNEANNFTTSHTHLFYYTRKRAKFTFNADQIRIPSVRQMAGDKRADPKGRLPDDTWYLRPVDFEMDPACDVMPMSRIAGTFKRRAGTPNQMPEQLLGRIIRACSLEGETVCDFFGGSGTTAVVAKKLGRRYLTSELSGAYATQIQFRLSACEVGDPLDGPIPNPEEEQHADDRAADRDAPPRRRRRVAEAG